MFSTRQKRSYELSQLSLEYFHEEFPTDREILEEASVIDMFGETDQKQANLGRKILALSSRLALVQAQRMQAEELCPVYQEIELPLIEVLASMEKTGIRADGEELEEIGVSLKEQIDKITAAVYESAGRRIQYQFPEAAGKYPFRQAEASSGKKDEVRLFHQC